MFLKIIVLLWLCAIWYCPSAIASGAPSVNQITISASGVDSLGITLMKDYSTEIGNKHRKQMLIRQDETIKVDSIAEPVKISQFQIYKGGEYWPLDEFVAHPGDSIHLDVRWHDGEPQVTFSGRGSQKYQCRNQILVAHEKRFQAPRLKTSEALGDTYFVVKNFPLIDRDFMDGLKGMMEVLESYKSDVDKLTYEVMEADVYARVEVIKLLTLLVFFQEAKSESDRNEVKTIYERTSWHNTNYDDDVLGLSYRFVRVILLKTQQDLFFRNEGRQYTLTEIYDEVKANYRGTLRERLLTSMLADPIARINFMLKSEDGYDEIVTDALRIIRSPTLRAPVEAAQLTASGNKAFPFFFTDVNGKRISNSDFKGKVVLLDIWFTGCSSCITFSEEFKKEVYAFVKGSPQFEVLSVCMDESGERWKKSLAGGRYSHPDYINVYTNGMGNKHPMLTHYNIAGAPSLLLIDKDGKIFGKPSAAMPKAQLLKLINQAIDAGM